MIISVANQFFFCVNYRKLLDQHPRGMRDWIILQSEPALELGNYTFANPPSHLAAPLPLDVDLMTQIEVSIVCTERLVCI